MDGGALYVRIIRPYAVPNYPKGLVWTPLDSSLQVSYTVIRLVLDLYSLTVVSRNISSILRAALNDYLYLPQQYSPSYWYVVFSLGSCVFANYRKRMRQNLVAYK